MELKKDLWSGYVLLYPPIGGLWNWLEKYFKSRPFTVGLVIELSTPLNFSSLLDMIQGCYSKSHTGPINKFKGTLQPTCEHRRSSRKLYTTLDHNFFLLCSQMTTKLVFLTKSLELAQLKSLESRLGDDLGSNFERIVFFNHPWRSFSGSHSRSRKVYLF